MDARERKWAVDDLLDRCLGPGGGLPVGGLRVVRPRRREPLRPLAMTIPATIPATQASAIGNCFRRIRTGVFTANSYRGNKIFARVVGEYTETNARWRGATRL